MPAQAEITENATAIFPRKPLGTENGQGLLHYHRRNPRTGAQLRPEPRKDQTYR
jgi:hypothetical protein